MPARLEDLAHDGSEVPDRVVCTTGIGQAGKIELVDGAHATDDGGRQAATKTVTVSRLCQNQPAFEAARSKVAEYSLGYRNQVV